MAYTLDQALNALLTTDKDDSRGSMYFKTVILPIGSAPGQKIKIDDHPLLQFLAYNKYYKGYNGSDPDGINPAFANFVDNFKNKARGKQYDATETKQFETVIIQSNAAGINATAQNKIDLVLKDGTSSLFATSTNTQGNVDWATNIDNWFPDVPAAKSTAKSFEVDSLKFLSTLRNMRLSSTNDGHDYFPLTSQLNETFKANAAPTTLISDEVDMIAQCVTNGDATTCHTYLYSLAKSGASEADLQKAINKISPKILIGALDTLGFKIKTMNGLTAIQDYYSWVKRAAARGITPPLLTELQNQTSLLAKLINMMVNRARTETLLEQEQQPTYTPVTPVGEVEFGLTGFYPVTHYQLAQKRMSPAEELQAAKRMIRDLQAASGLHRLRNMNGYIMQFGGEPDYQSGGDGVSVYTNLFESLYKQVKAATGRDVDEKTRGIISDAIANLEKYDIELRRFLKDLGIVSVVSNIFANTPQGNISQGMLHAAVTKYKACLAKYAIRQGNILGVADQLCNGAV